MQFIKTICCEGDVAKVLSNGFRKYKVIHLKLVPNKDLFKFYRDLFAKLGECVPMDEDVATGNKTGYAWISIKYDPVFPMSYRHSDKRQPLHTDGSYESNAPDINFFFCVEKAQIGGATTFIDSRDLVRYLEVYDKVLLQEIKNTPVKFSKGTDSKIRPIIIADGDDYRLTWNSFRVDDDPGFCSKFNDFLEHKIVDGGVLTPIVLEPGEAVFFNDELVLHGRNSFIGNRFLYKGGFKWK